MIPQSSDMRWLVSNLDQVLHQEGEWGLPPLLAFVLHSEGLGFVSAMYPQQPKNLRELNDLVDRIERGAFGSRLILERHGLFATGDAVAGLFFVHEGRIRFDGRLTKNRLRACVLVDCAGRGYVVLRSEGEPETDLVFLGPRQEYEHDPRAVQALRRMLRAVGSYMKADAIDRKALSW